MIVVVVYTQAYIKKDMTNGDDLSAGLKNDMEFASEFSDQEKIKDRCSAEQVKEYEDLIKEVSSVFLMLVEKKETNHTDTKLESLFSHAVSNFAFGVFNGLISNYSDGNKADIMMENAKVLSMVSEEVQWLRQDAKAGDKFKEKFQRKYNSYIEREEHLKEMRGQ